MLRKFRVAAAWIVAMCAAVLLVDFTGVAHAWLGWVARVQLVPAVLAVEVAAIAFVVVMTLLFGRIYCSAICPLGVAQDGVIWSARKRFKYSLALPVLRWMVLGAFVLALIFGAAAVVVALDPWGIFGRVVQNLVGPVWRLGNNLLAWGAERVDSYAFYGTEVHLRSGLALGLAAVWTVGLAVLAWRRGRWYCNSLCPVGSVLGLLSRVSVFRPVIDEAKCTKCGACERACKSECIDSKALTIDRSRCVVCFDCVDKCKFGGIKYTARRSTSVSDPSVSKSTKGVSRRAFFAIAGAAATAPIAARAQQLQVDGGLADLVDKRRPERKTPITPPGSRDARNMRRHCTACQLCVAACPNNVLVPSSRLETLLQPEVTFERGYCRPECVECSMVCPTDAIERISTAEKTAIAIGQAQVFHDLCLVRVDEVACTQCQRHCPASAISLVERMPVVDPAICIGCGACENLCPARPLAAIRVEGNSTHHIL